LVIAGYSLSQNVGQRIMGKVKLVAAIIGSVVGAYMVLLALFPAILSIFQSASTTIAAKPNIARYLGAPEIVAFLPWTFWFLPAVIGTVALIIVLKQQSGE
jgi:hypothetical protein